jgi:hypothetical protein
MAMIVINLVTHKTRAKPELLFNKLASGLTHKLYTMLQRLVRHKHSSLFCPFVSYKEKVFVNMAPAVYLIVILSPFVAFIFSDNAALSMHFTRECYLKGMTRYK